jgi:hypothetical protein
MRKEFNHTLNDVNITLYLARKYSTIFEINTVKVLFLCDNQSSIIFLVKYNNTL